LIGFSGQLNYAAVDVVEQLLLGGAVRLVALWAFVSHLQPSFSGEQAAELLRCG
jgi:hypothetical protein